MLTQCLHDRLMAPRESATGIGGNSHENGPHLEPEPTQNTVQYRHVGNGADLEVEGLMQLHSFTQILRCKSSFPLLQKSLERFNILSCRQLGCCFRTERLKTKTNGADLHESLLADHGDSDVARGAENQRFIMCQPQDRIANGSDAGPELIGHLPNAQALTRLEFARNQGIAKGCINRIAEILVINGDKF